MRLKAEKTGLKAFRGDCLVLGLFKEKAVLNRFFENPEFQKAVKEALEEAQQSKSFESEAGQLFRIPTLGKEFFKQLLILGLGEEKNAGAETFRKAAAAAIQTAKANGFQTIGMALHENPCKVPLNERFQAESEGALLASYEAPNYQKEPKKIPKPEQCTILCSVGAQEAERIIAETETVCGYVFKVRDWVNWPATKKNPRFMASLAKQESKKLKVKCTVFSKAQLQKMGMNALLAVNSGSKEPPFFVQLEYKPMRFRKTIALVGKGITFDSGGLNLKPWEGMLTMKDDMAGAAACMGAVFSAAALKLPVRVLAFLPFTENLPGNNPMKTGDIIQTFGGKTIEVVHTDAEGRLILADALGFAEKQKPDCMIDLATLTGAQFVALGRYFIGALGNNPGLLKKVLDAGNKTMERCWELPLIDEWSELMKSRVADVQNLSNGPRGEAGTILGAAFLKAFVEKTPWVHLDIASTAFFSESDSLRPYLPAGASGMGVRLLVEFLRKEC